MELSLTEPCPQCGAPVDLKEADRLLTCPYCGVKSLITAPEPHRFLLRPEGPGNGIRYLPYLRFKGMAFSLLSEAIGHRILDLTCQGLSHPWVPPSLGLRPQAVKLTFAKEGIGGTLVRPDSDVQKLLARMEKGPPGAPERRETLYLGETVSWIYLPLRAEAGDLCDALSGRPLPGVRDPAGCWEALEPDTSAWGLRFVPSLCPVCGWDLDGERDSRVLSCGNCQALWELAEGDFLRVPFSLVEATTGEALYLPFWEILASDGNGRVKTFADFLRVTCQPKVPREGWGEGPVPFVVPAFKIRPELFLSLSRHLTLARGDWPRAERLPRKGLFPVTFPRGEALEALVLVLAASSLHRKGVFPLLREVRFEPKEWRLLYLPFVERGQEVVQETLSLAVNRNALRFGRSL